MNSFRNRFYFWGAFFILICITGFVWYVLFFAQKPKSNESSTFVWNAEEVLVADVFDEIERLQIAETRKSAEGPVQL